MLGTSPPLPCVWDLIQGIRRFSRTEIRHPSELHGKTILVLVGWLLVLLEPFRNCPFATRAVMLDSLASALGGGVDVAVRLNGATDGFIENLKTDGGAGVAVAARPMRTNDAVYSL